MSEVVRFRVQGSGSEFRIQGLRFRVWVERVCRMQPCAAKTRIHIGKVNISRIYEVYKDCFWVKVYGGIYHEPDVLDEYWGRSSNIECGIGLR